MEAPSPIIITKILVPRRRPDLLHRPRTIDFLSHYIDRKLIIISASAGYGKTSLLVDFSHSTDMPVCWYSVGKADHDLPTFLDYLIASIRQQLPHFAKALEPYLAAPEALFDDLDTLVGLFVNELYEATPDHFLLIIDDYHHADQSRVISTFMDTLLYYLPGNCHFVLSSRTVPSLTLTRLAARQEVAGLGSTDLRFTAEEIQELVKQNYGLDMPLAQASKLAEQHEGWITGILLRTHTLWQGLLESMIRACEQEGESHVFEYLADEVFDLQTPETKDFLIASSVLGQLWPELCDDLLEIDNSLSILSYLEQQNLFIVRFDGPGYHYRYHSTFQEFLETRLRRRDPSQHRALHLRAAELLQPVGDYSEVIHHYLEGGAPESAADLIERVAEQMFSAGRWETLARWIGSLPDELLAQRPHLVLYHARTVMRIGQLQQALTLYDQAESAFVQREDATGQAQVAIYRSTVQRLLGQYGDAIAACRSALASLDGTDPLLVAQGYRNRGLCYALQGRFSQGIKELSKALKSYQQAGDPFNEAQVHHDLGTLLEISGSPDMAAGHLRQAQAHWEQTNNAGALAHTLNSIALSWQHQGCYEEALHTAEEALVHAERSGNRLARAYTLSVLGGIHRDRGALDRAAQVYEDGLKAIQEIGEASLRVYLLDGLSNTHRLQGDGTRAESYLRQALAFSEEHKSDYEIGLCEVSLGILACERGEVATATERLSSACALFQKGGAQRDLTRALLYLAGAAFLGHDLDTALAHLKSALDLASETGSNQLLVVEGRHLVPLLEYGVEHGVGDEHFAAIVEQVKNAQNTSPTAAKHAPQTVMKSRARRRLEIHAFGKAEVFREGHLLTSTDWDSAVTKELFFFFLTDHQGLRKEQIMDTFWPELSPKKATSRLHSTNYRLRQALYPDCVVYQNGWYVFNSEIDYWYDVEEFENLLEKAEKLGPGSEEGAECYMAAIALYRGDYLEEFYSDWSFMKREELRERFLNALISLGDFYAGRGEHTRSIEAYKRVLAKDSYREDVYQKLIRAYNASGDRGSAIKLYQECIRILDEELGLEPMPETIALYEEMVGSAAA